MKSKNNLAALASLLDVDKVERNAYLRSCFLRKERYSLGALKDMDADIETIEKAIEELAYGNR